jgi:hypothetical protein
VSAFGLLGLLIALLALAFVLYPLLLVSRSAEPASAQLNELQARRRELYRQILDLEFDQRLGKLDPADAGALSHELFSQATALLAQEPTAAMVDVEAEVEREILAVRQALAAAHRSELGPVAS